MSYNNTITLYYCHMTLLSYMSDKDKTYISYCADEYKRVSSLKHH